MKKLIFLFLALLLPGLIFVFLKKFGKNEFAIPVYTPSIDSLNRACATGYTAPYKLPDSVLEKTGWKGKPASLFAFDPDAATTQELGRIQEPFTPDELQILNIRSGEGMESIVSRWRSCAFVARPGINLVLVDGEKRIRGYYTLGSRKEADRLEVELAILLEKY